MPIDSGSNRFIPRARRQTVLSGPFDANGKPTAITNTANGVRINASPAAPFVASISAGHDAAGAVEYYVYLTANLDLTLPGVGNAGQSYTTYLYLERNASTGIVTLQNTDFRPEYSLRQPTATGTPNRNWFNPATMQMRRWDGVFWSPAQRLFVGEVTMLAGALLPPITYAYNAYYQSEPIAIVANTSYSFDHFLGYPVGCFDFRAVAHPNSTSTAAMLEAPRRENLWDNVAGVNRTYGVLVTSTTSPWHQCNVFTTNFPVLDNNPVQWLTSGTLALTVSRLW